MQVLGYIGQYNINWIMRRCATGMTVNNRNGTWPVVGNTFRTDNGLEILYCMGSIHSPNFFYTPIDLLFAIIYDGNAVTAKHLEYDARIIVWVRNKNAWYYLFWGKFSIEPSYIYIYLFTKPLNWYEKDLLKYQPAFVWLKWLNEKIIAC